MKGTISTENTSKMTSAEVVCYMQVLMSMANYSKKTNIVEPDLIATRRAV